MFERIDFSKVERLLATVAEEASLQLLSFENQIAGSSSKTVPDARIQGRFSLWFETKTSPGALRAAQIEGHLGHLEGSTGAIERLYIITPDATPPTALREFSDPRLVWFNFVSLSQAIDLLLADELEMVSEKEELLLRELQALLVEDGLLGDPRDVLVVPARHAYQEYLDTNAYICQPRRSFRPIDRMAFYQEGAIQPIIPHIRHVRDEVLFSQSTIEELTERAGPHDEEIARLIREDHTGRPADSLYKVMLLTAPENPQTIQLDGPIQNDAVDASGRPVAWVQGQRYASLDTLRRARTTSELGDANARNR